MRLSLNSGRFRRPECCAVNRYLIFICSPVNVDTIRLVFFTERGSWSAPLDKWPRTGHQTHSWLRTKCPRVPLRLRRRRHGSHFNCRKNNTGTFRLVVRFWKVKSIAHTNTRGLNCGNIGISISLFVLGAAVGVTMSGGFVIRTPNISSATILRYLSPITDRAL